MDRIQLDYTHILADSVGPTHGLDEQRLMALAGPSMAALSAVQARRTTDLRWLELPHQDEMLDEIVAYAASVRGQFENVVVLGIGGSALGPRALHTALNSP